MLATVTATLFASGTVLAGEQKAKEEAKVHCAGINACKGQGYKDVTQEECEAKGGKVIKG